MTLSDMVIAGNSFLREYARRHTSRVALIPTSIDTSAISPKVNGGRCGRSIIGWIGSHTTEKYVRGLRPMLQRLSQRCKFSMKIVGAQRSFLLDGVDVAQLPWDMRRELHDFGSCDIGIYPLWNDEWAQGKCGFKAIQFMAAGVPVVASAVGANREIIQDGVNGFLAATEDEWCEKLALLVEDPALRQKLGEAGRRTVDAHYSLAANAPKFLSILTNIVSGS
jgi:glycosyltransferase involved in cell wall biosynthesis